LIDFDPFIAAVSAALLTRTSQGVANAASTAWSALVRMVAKKLATSGFPELGAARGGDADDVALREALERAVQQDPEFDTRLRSLWQQAQVQMTASGEFVQQAARDITVNYLFAAPSPEPTRHLGLPASTSVFVNRISEQVRLDSLAGDPTAGIRLIVLTGMPGIGKSSLAVRWGSRRQDRFPGGQFFAEYGPLLNDPDGGEAASEAVLTSFLRAMGVPDGFLRGGLQALENRYRTMSARHAQLVVVDGPTEPAQVLPLIPAAPGSVVIVSSEHDLGALAMKGAQFVDVGPLDDDAALELLEQMCGSSRISVEQAAAARLVDLCGGLAAALQVVGARLVLDSTLTLSALADELADERRRLDGLSLPGRAGRTALGAVAPAFTTTYRHLDDDAQQLYRDIAVLPVLVVTDDLLTGIGWSDAAATRMARDTLLSVGLLGRAGVGRYRQHDLIRLHATELAENLQQRRNLRITVAAIEYLARTAWFADHMVMGDRLHLVAPPAGADAATSPFRGLNAKTEALQWLESNKDDLLRTLRAAVDYADREVDEHALRLAESMAALYLNHRHAADWVETTRLGVQLARRCGRHDIEARLRSLVSRLHTDQGDVIRARLEIEAAFEAMALVENPALLASVWEFWARFLEIVDREQALIAYEKAIELNIAAGMPRGEALCRYFLGSYLDRLGRSPEALSMLRQARSQFNAVDDGRMSARADASIGLALLHIGEYRQARAELEVAAAYFIAAELWHYEAPARENLAQAAAALGDVPSARRHLERAIVIEEAVGGPNLSRLRTALATLS
jgi:tetratricopeptide (TPR) repeat protein